jgi:hypothetical protein
MVTRDVLYLFSSNIRPLYEQDVLNVLAAPRGLPYRFRYGRNRMTDEVAGAWGPELVGRRCLVCFSLQQPNEYQEAVFFPIRLGSVLRATREAQDLYLLEFAVDRVVGLREPQTPEGSSAPPGRAYAAEVRAFREALDQNRIAAPYASWASFGPDLTEIPGVPLDSTTDEGALFNRMGRYLAGTLSYQQATFIHIQGITAGAGEGRREIAFDASVGAFLLRSGASYRLEAIMSQPREPTTPASFGISASDDVLRMVGPSRLEMAGRYDLVPVPFIAAEVASALPRDGTLEIAPQGVAQGARLILPVRIEPDSTRNAVGVGLSALGLFVLGWAGLLNDAPVIAGILVVIGGALAVGVPVLVAGRLPWSS